MHACRVNRCGNDFRILSGPCVITVRVQTFNVDENIRKSHLDRAASAEHNRSKQESKL
jgi:hypothetical protein